MTIKPYHPLTDEKDKCFRFVRVGTSRLCSYCGKSIVSGSICFNYQYVLNTHLECMDNFAEKIQSFKKDNIKELMLGELEK